MTGPRYPDYGGVCDRDPYADVPDPYYHLCGRD